MKRRGKKNRTGTRKKCKTERGQICNRKRRGEKRNRKISNRKPEKKRLAGREIKMADVFTQMASLSMPSIPRLGLCPFCDEHTGNPIPLGRLFDCPIPFFFLSIPFSLSTLQSALRHWLTVSRLSLRFSFTTNLTFPFLFSLSPFFLICLPNENELLSTLTCLKAIVDDAIQMTIDDNISICRCRP